MAGMVRGSFQVGWSGWLAAGVCAFGRAEGKSGCDTPDHRTDLARPLGAAIRVGYQVAPGGHVHLDLARYLRGWMVSVWLPRAVCVVINDTVLSRWRLAMAVRLR
jgi:hypothetical protein